MGRRRFLQILAGIGALFTGIFRPAIAQAQTGPIITADPAELTLAPGGSAMVLVNVDPSSPYGLGSVTVAVNVPAPYDGTIQGDTSVTVPAGQHWHITGDVNLTGDLIVEGLLTGVDTFTLEGNRFQILVMNGGQLDLAGIQKSAWVRRGDIPVGWQISDRLAVAPTAAAKYTPAETTWQGDATVWPVNSPDVTKFGLVMRPEVINLSQTIVLKNLRRIHFHDGAGVQNLKWLKVVDSGTLSVVDDYPIHFHMNGDASRGSLLEDVVVENGLYYAFVPHASHGITFRGCAVYKVKASAFWWNPPPIWSNPINDSHDIVYERCGALSVNRTGTGANHRLSAIPMGSGNGNVCKDSWASCVNGGPGAQSPSGFIWPETGSGLWEFSGNVVHNNPTNGIYVWQNNDVPHLVEGFTGYHNGAVDIEHGAYGNRYEYRNIEVEKLAIHATGWKVTGAGHVGIVGTRKHTTTGTVTFTDVTVGALSINNAQSGGTKAANYVFNNTGLTCANVTIVSMVPGTQVIIDGVACPLGG